MEILKTYRWREGVLSIKSVQDHMGASRVQPLEPCPLGAPPLRPCSLGIPVEILWGHCPENPALLGGSCGGLKYMF